MVGLLLIALFVAGAAVSVLADASTQAFASETIGATSGTPDSSEHKEAVDASAYSPEELLDAQTSHAETLIPDSSVPMSSWVNNGAAANGGASGANDGSLVNTILATVCAISMVLAMFALTRRKNSSFSVVTVRTVAVAIGLVMVSTWSLLDKLATPTLLLNDSSSVIITMFVLYTIALVASFVWESHADARRGAGRHGTGRHSAERHGTSGT
jgi:hypothetical protein